MVRAMKILKTIAVMILLAGWLHGVALQSPTSAAPSPTPAASPSPSESAPPPRVAEPQRVRVSQGVMDSMKTRDVQPEYPNEAKKKHISGDVLLKAIIDREGHVAELTLISGNSILAESAVKAVKQWRYKPYILNGKPVDIETMITVKYHM
jgi:periplasmic protein TonB